MGTVFTGKGRGMGKYTHGFSLAQTHHFDAFKPLTIFITKCFTFISIRKVAIYKIQKDLESRNDAPSSVKNFLFRNFYRRLFMDILQLSQ
jgi:hypothetical protein